MSEGNSKKQQGQKTAPREGPLVQVTGRPMTRGISMPLIGASTQQLAVPIIDVSSSMSGAKIAEANAATVGLVAELANPKNRRAFYAALVVYAERAQVQLQQKLTEDVRPDELAASVGPLGSRTNITSGLEAAESCVRANQGRPGNWARPIVLLLSDGGHNEGPAPDAIAQSLKATCDIIAVGFGADADYALLKRLATSPKHAFSCGNGTALRDFFATVGRTMSQAARTGMNASALLSGGGVVRG